MKIEKIVLKNFRVHRDFTFIPAEDGITSINGENGTGKSTIVDGFSWSLFGTRLHGLRNLNYITEGVDATKEPVQVESYLMIENQRIKVKRRIVNNNGTTQCWVYSMNEAGEYEEVAGPTVTHAEEFIRRVTGLDESGFLTSVFVQQKQVDQIISATPSQRSDVIEKMIGINAISSGIQAAKEESKSLQKAASIIQVKSLVEMENLIEEQKEKIKTTQESLKEKNSIYNAIKDEYRELEEIITLEEEKREKAKNAKEEIQSLTKVIKSLEESIKEDITLYKSIKKEAPLLLSIDELREKQKKFHKKIDSLNTSIAKINYEEKQDKEILEKKFSKTIIREEKHIASEIEERQTSIEEFKKRLNLIKDKVDKQKKYLKLLEEGIAICPTCGHDVKNSEEHKEEIVNELTALAEEEKEIKKEATKLQKELKVLEEKFKNIERMKALEIQRKEAEKRQEANSKEKEKLLSEKQGIMIESSVVDEQLNQWKTDEENQKLKINLKSKIERADNKAKELQEEKSEKLKALEEMKNTLRGDFRELKSRYRKVYKEFSESLAFLERFKEREEQEKEKFEILNKQYQENREAEEKYKSLINNLNIINTSIQTLLRFKEDRLYKSIPRLIEVASDILFKFTDGEFVELNLDDKFNCSVKTRGGQIRPVEQLSGGELSASAIALRFAISFFLSNETNNLLILDEVLVSMSEERAQKALEVISSIKNTQIILIAHNEYSDGLANKVVLL